MKSRAGDLESFLADDRGGADVCALRSVLAGAPLVETLRRGAACYTHGGASAAFLGGFSDVRRLDFCKGTLIYDPEGRCSPPGGTCARRNISAFGP